jgi:hypothetical protein
VSSSYWFSIIHADVSHGGAFLISRKYALTATHCLPKGYRTASESIDPSRVKLVSENGTELYAIVSETDGDLTLLEVVAFRKHTVIPPTIRQELVEKDSPWEAPYRPSPHHPTLTGVVGNPDLKFQSADGSIVSVIQLTVSEEIGDHSGYSGGPVLGKTSRTDPVAIIGILIEQFPDRVNQNRAANVLFATRIACAFLHFAAFNFAEQLNIPKTTSLQEQGKRAEFDVDFRLNEAEEILERAKLWAEKAYIDDYDHTIIKARVRDLVFSERSTGSRT